MNSKHVGIDNQSKLSLVVMVSNLHIFSKLAETKSGYHWFTKMERQTFLEANI